MKDTSKVAKNYALALAELAGSDIQLQEKFLSEITEVNNALSSFKDAKKILENPGISKEEKKKIVVETLQRSVSTVVTNFLFLLIDNHRFNLLPEIQNFLSKFVNKKKGIVIAEVYSACEIDESTTKTILETLHHNVSTNNATDIKIEKRIDPALIGGIKIKINDLVYDGSIKGRLENLKRRLG